MGYAARNRGTFEERKAQSVQRSQEEATRRKRAEAEREANMTPKKRLSRKAQAAIMLFGMSGFQILDELK